ncbi:uncharacterized protein VTP21DRAFT_9716 [Calcarisporiella thermophila]|uniref:uncharacterized protein n=1 Tax=Calcarisporiella thermophila TaxID=911321 RepID=UPI0037422C23
MVEIRHVVVFKFKPTVTKEQRDEVIEKFHALEHTVLREGQRTIKSIEDGENISIEPCDLGYHHVIQVTFYSIEDRDFYVKESQVHEDFKNYALQFLDLDDSEDVQINQTEKIRAAFVVLIRNSDVENIIKPIKQLEANFNHNYGYPWIFLNNDDFTEDFKQRINTAANITAYFGKLYYPENWSYPPWIDEEKARFAREKMKNAVVNITVIHGIRFESGFFYRHPLLQDIDYYWRVEPWTDYSCEIDFDPFRFMKENNKKYGFTIALHELRETIPTLWKTVREFIDEHRHLIPANNSFDFVTDDNGLTFNLCHFWSNFEIGDMRFLRSEEYTTFFEYMDHAVAASPVLPLLNLNQLFGSSAKATPSVQATSPAQTGSSTQATPPTQVASPAQTGSTQATLPAQVASPAQAGSSTQGISSAKIGALLQGGGVSLLDLNKLLSGLIQVNPAAKPGSSTQNTPAGQGAAAPQAMSLIDLNKLLSGLVQANPKSQATSPAQTTPAAQAASPTPTAKAASPSPAVSPAVSASPAVSPAVSPSPAQDTNPNTASNQLAMNEIIRLLRVLNLLDALIAANTLTPAAPKAT